MKTYRIRVSREGRLWYIDIPAIDGATQARHLREVEEMARDYIHNATGQERVELDVEMVMPAEAQEHLDREAALRAEAAAATSRASAEARAAARALRRQGLAYREIGAMLGVSYQRAHQLTRDHQDVA